VEYKFLNSANDYTIILSGDCFILFEHINEQNAKIIFWCSFYAISDIQIIQSLKSATINFYDNKSKKDFVLKLYIENTVLFRDILITRMKALNIKISVKIIDSNSKNKEKKRLTIKDMSKMKLALLENNINDMKNIIDKGEIDEYTINTFSTLCGTAIDILSNSSKKVDEEKQKQYSKMMEDVYKLEKVDEFKNNDEIINESNEINISINKDKQENKIEADLIDGNKIVIDNNDKNEIINDEFKDKNEKMEGNYISNEIKDNTNFFYKFIIFKNMKS
jgi:hypothetical protein